MKVFTYKRSRGFSLVEVLIGVAVIVIILLGLFATFMIVTSGILNTKQSEQIAVKLLSELERVEGDTNLAVGTTSTYANGTTIITEITRVIPSGPKSNDGFNVSVTARWTSPTGVSRDLTMTRTKSRYADINASQTGGDN